MNAQEVEHVRRNQQQRFDGTGVERCSEFRVEPSHRVGGEMRRDWLEAYDRGAVRPGFRDVVVNGFPTATAAGRELKQIPV